MKVIQENNKIKHIEFGYSEFVDFSEARVQSSRAIEYGCNSSRKNDNSTSPWSGSKNLEQALDWARHGWDAGLAQLPLEDGTLTNTGIEIEASVAGAMVNIGNYLTGQPECMWDFRETRVFNLDELTIYTRLDYNAGNNYEKAMRFCNSIATVANFYQSKYNVRIIGRFDVAEQGINSIVDVIIKEFDSRFTINNVAFAFHPAFFRRIWFGYMESENFIDSGYGRANSTSKHIDDIKKQALSGQKILICPQIEATDGGKFEFENMTKINVE